MKIIDSSENYKQVIALENVILMFSADWCPDCRAIEPILPELEKENEKHTFYYVDRDKFIELCQELNVFGIPSFIAFHHGQETGRFVNKERKSKEQIQEFINGLK
ncbi:thioredoxin family protein [Metabacillus arenae]|uniref:Thioredoxin family protein n=1 Tax=Metabacillus arenae TaxID=2771434 RepID=A0A926NG32_9BACI|nr:thioredoxin family protein [Metabacillus arenae]MBD1380160.1 thioredoxin family protein [Metabacillus arenae]